jgi:hypothetical protein
MTGRRSARDWQERLRDPSLTALLVLQIAGIFLATPLAAVGFPVPRLGGLTLILAAVSLVVLVSRTRFALLVGIASFVVSVGSVVYREHRPSDATYVASAVGVVLALSALNWVVAGAVFAPGRITYHRIQGAVVLYLNLAMTFGALFRLIAELRPNAFSGLPPFGGQGFESALFYFSFTTLTSTGYGDIVPLHPFARSLANLEAIVGQLYPATLLARIVTLELEQRRR